MSPRRKPGTVRSEFRPSAKQPWRNVPEIQVVRAPGLGWLLLVFGAFLCVDHSGFLLGFRQ